MEKSFIVQGKGLEEALDKAAIVLHCDKERVAYEILQEPTPGRYGQPGVLCKLRVTPVAPSAEELGPHGVRDAQSAILDVLIPLSEEELTVLSSPFFLKELGEALARDLAAGLKSIAQGTSGTAPSHRDIFGSVNPASSPLEHVGDLHIHGDVRKGVRIEATGAIHVNGGVETAFLDAGGDIVIAEGLLGTARSTNGAIQCRFAQGAQIQALCGSVGISESAMHCQIHAGGTVTVGDILLGGSCYGEELVQVRIAGSDSGVPTVLLAGRNRHVYEQVEQIRQRALNNITWLSESDAIRQELLPSEEANSPLPPPERVRLWQAVIRKARLNADLRQISHQKSTLLGMINAERGSRISVTDRAHPRVKVGIDDITLEVRKLTQFVTFSKDYELSELRMTPYR